MEKSQHGDISQALAEADSEYRKYSVREPERAWRFRVLEGQLLVVQGKPNDALNLLNENIPPSLSGSDVDARRDLVQGLALGFTQRYDQAEADLNRAETLARPLEPKLLAEVILSQGIVQLNEGHYDQAGARFRAALDIARERNLLSFQSRAMGSLGNVAMWQEHYDEAVDWYKAALHASEASGAKDASATTLGNIGWSYASMGDFENALAYFQQAEDAASKSGLVRGQAEWLINIGDIYNGQRDYERAESAYQNALALARKTDYQTAIGELLDDLAVVSLQKGDIRSATTLSNDAAALATASKDHFLIPHSLLAQGQVEAAARKFADARNSLNAAIADKDAPTSLRWEAEAQLAEVDAAEGNRAQADSEFQRSIQTIEAARASVKTEEFRLSFLSSAISVYSDYIDFLVNQKRNEDALQVAELSRARTLADGLGFSSASLSFPIRNFHPTKTARSLGATILCYWLGQKHSYVWAIDANHVRLAQLLATDEIDPLVASYRRTLTGPRDALEADTTTGEKLYSALVASAIPKLPPHARVVVIPDGSLYQLNFETLIAPNPAPHYFIDDATITNANSLVLLAASARAKPAAAKKLLLVGDPVPFAADFPKLPQAESEMRDIENYFPGVNSTIFSQASATPGAYLTSHPEQFAFIHFVAHGTASRTSPLDSAVILSKQGDSYKLYARDVIRQPLRAELVTISACSGAGERTYSGEGLVGLSWAFLHAGAHDVISALWEVDDNSTTQLMNRLYAELSKGATPETALRDAKLAMVHSDSVYKKPFYWAPFQIYRGP